ncbi:MAG: DUF3575 domain-containing protein [Bacteroidetes bacterium]|nr:DUF3575 domain-containing protein [Bacteroidota bacterium]
MKRTYAIAALIVFMCFSLNQVKAQQNLPDLIIRATTSITNIEDIDALLALGFGAEARLGNKLTITGDVAFGQSEGLSYIFVNPALRYYVFNRNTRGLFIKAGTGFNQIKSTNNFTPVGYPFGNERGSTVGYFNLEIGAGFATVVKDHFTMGFSASLASPLDIDIGGFAVLHADFSVGYAF